jgi:hypothetical protein
LLSRVSAFALAHLPTEAVEPSHQS